MQDIILDSSNDLLIKDGDLVIGESTLQHQRTIVVANKGEFKDFPEVGVGIVEALEDDNPAQILQTIKRQFQYDGMVVENISLTPDGNLKVNAKYKE